MRYGVAYQRAVVLMEADHVEQPVPRLEAWEEEGGRAEGELV